MQHPAVTNSHSLVIIALAGRQPPSLGLVERRPGGARVELAVVFAQALLVLRPRQHRLAVQHAQLAQLRPPSHVHLRLCIVWVIPHRPAGSRGRTRRCTLSPCVVLRDTAVKCLSCRRFCLALTVLVGQETLRVVARDLGEPGLKTWGEF